MKKYLLLALWLLFPLLLFSQGAIKKKSTLSEKVFFGGGFGLQFGSSIAVEVSPMMGYKPYDNWYLGLKGVFQFYKNTAYNQTTQIYGGSFFTSYVIFENIALYAEYEALNLETEYFDPMNTSLSERFWVHSPLIGGGFVQPIGGRSKLLMLILWNLNDSYYSPYSNPIIRLTFFY